MTLTPKRHSWNHIFVFFGPKKWKTFKSNQTFIRYDYKELFEKILNGDYDIRYESDD
jgi:hypothetical protein